MSSLWLPIERNLTPRVAIRWSGVPDTPLYEAAGGTNLHLLCNLCLSRDCSTHVDRLHVTLRNVVCKDPFGELRALDLWGKRMQPDRLAACGYPL